MKVALVHDWLTGMRGGERVLERLCGLFPDAHVFTLVWNRGSVSPPIERHPITSSFLQRLPGAARYYRWYLPLFPAAVEPNPFLIHASESNNSSSLMPTFSKSADHMRSFPRRSSIER